MSTRSRAGRGKQRGLVSQSTVCGRCKRDLEVEEVGKYHRCEECRVVVRGIRRRRTARLVAEGVCVYCQNKLTDDPYRKFMRVGATRCSYCFFRAVAYDHFDNGERGEIIRRIFDLQRGRCAISGEPLILQLNASLDHRTPRGRGGDPGPGNVWWVTRLANFAKTSMTPDEHVAFSELVVAYRHSSEYLEMARRLQRAADDGWPTTD